MAEFESGNVDVLQIPPRRPSAWEQTTRRRRCSRRARAAHGLRRDQYDARPAHATFAFARRSTTRSTRGMILRRLMGGRGTLAGGVIPPSLDGDDPRARAVSVRHDASARSCFATPATPTASTSSSGTSQSEQFPRIAATIQAYLARVGIRVKLVQRDASSMREAARNGKTDMALKDWYADYPDAENFLYPLLHSANKGVGGNVSFYANAAFDSRRDRRRGASRTTRSASRCTSRPTRWRHDAGADGVLCFFRPKLYAVQPWIKGFIVPSIFTGQRWTDVSHRPRRAALTGDLASSSGGCCSRSRRCSACCRRVPAALRRARRPGAGNGRRTRRRGDDRASAQGATARRPASRTVRALRGRRPAGRSRHVVHHAPADHAGHARALSEDAAARRHRDAARRRSSALLIGVLSAQRPAAGSTGSRSASPTSESRFRSIGSDCS